MRNPAPITSAEPSCRTAAFLNAASTSSSKGSQMQNGSKPEKPNSLPVLNCLFAALNKQRGQAESDDTSPYTLNQPKVLLKSVFQGSQTPDFPLSSCFISMSLFRYLTSCTWTPFLHQKVSSTVRQGTTNSIWSHSGPQWLREGIGEVRVGDWLPPTHKTISECSQFNHRHQRRQTVSQLQVRVNEC